MAIGLIKTHSLARRTEDPDSDMTTLPSSLSRARQAWSVVGGGAVLPDNARYLAKEGKKQNPPAITIIVDKHET